MIKESVVVKADPGFDGRPIALLVQEASQYASTVYIQVGEKHINAKSIMGMMRKKQQRESNLFLQQ